MCVGVCVGAQLNVFGCRGVGAGVYVCRCVRGVGVQVTRCVCVYVCMCARV